MTVEAIGNGNKFAAIAKGAAENIYLRLAAGAFAAAAGPTMIWIAAALWDLNKQAAIIDGRVNGLQIRIESQMDGRYRITDAERDFRLRDQIISGLQKELDRQDKRLDTLERGKGK